MEKTAETALRDAFQPPGRRLKKSFFARSVHEVAPDLIGATFLVNGVGGIIVEVEAYDQTDPAAHSFRGPTPRNMVMFGPPGYTYVYLSYGLNWCVNFVCQAAGSAAGVLIRAIEPTHGLAAMRRPRGRRSGRAVLRPGKIVRGACDHESAQRTADRQAADRVACTQRRSRSHHRSQDRPNESGRSAVALRTERLAIPQQAILSGSPCRLCCGHFC